MKRRWIALVVFGAALCLFLSTPALSGKLEGLQGALDKLGFAPVPKTGSIIDYPAPGDDGELLMGVTWPDPRFTDNEDGTVTDNLTGLIWTKNANMFGGLQWQDDIALPTEYPACEACATLNSGENDLEDGSVEGDWRLPNVRELQSLVDYGRSTNNPLPENHPFTGVTEFSYWSSTTTEAHSYSAWFVHFGDHGSVRYTTKLSDTPHVWCVRAGK